MGWVVGTYPKFATGTEPTNYGADHTLGDVDFLTHLQVLGSPTWGIMQVVSVGGVVSVDGVGGSPNLEAVYLTSLTTDIGDTEAINVYQAIYGFRYVGSSHVMDPLRSDEPAERGISLSASGARLLAGATFTFAFQDGDGTITTSLDMVLPPVDDNKLIAINRLNNVNGVNAEGSAGTLPVVFDTSGTNWLDGVATWGLALQTKDMNTTFHLGVGPGSRYALWDIEFICKLARRAPFRHRQRDDTLRPKHFSSSRQATNRRGSSNVYH